MVGFTLNPCSRIDSATVISTRCSNSSAQQAHVDTQGPDDNTLQPGDLRDARRLSGVAIATATRKTSAAVASSPTAESIDPRTGPALETADATDPKRASSKPHP
jgi:hypothetical protein